MESPGPSHPGSLAHLFLAATLLVTVLGVREISFGPTAPPPPSTHPPHGSRSRWAPTCKTLRTRRHQDRPPLEHHMFRDRPHVPVGTGWGKTDGLLCRGPSGCRWQSLAPLGPLYDSQVHRLPTPGGAARHRALMGLHRDDRGRRHAPDARAQPPQGAAKGSPDSRPIPSARTTSPAVRPITLGV